MSKILVIELTETDAKLLQASSTKNGMVVEFASRVSFDGLEKSDEGNAERQTRVAAEAKKIKAIASEVLLVIPKQSVILRSSVLPTGDPHELAEMVVFEAEKMIPFNAERHTISYAITEGPAMEGTEVMVSAVDQPVIHQWLDIASGAKAEARTVDVSCLALAHASLIDLPTEETPEAYALFQIGINTTEVTIVSNGKVATTRSIPRNGIAQLLETIPGDSGWETWLEKNLNTVYVSVEEAKQPINTWFAKLLTQFQRTIEFAQRDQKIPMIKHVFVCGEAAAIPGFSDILASRIGFSTPVISPLEKAELAKDTGIEKAYLPVFTTAYGAANRQLLYPEIDKINLLPMEVLESQQSAERRVHLTVTGLIAVVALVIVFIHFNSIWQNEKREVENLSAYLNDLDIIVEQLDDREERIDIIRKIRSEQAGALDILGRISAYPEMGSNTIDDGRLTLSNFEFELADEVRIDGYAMTNEDITQFVRYLSGLENRGKTIFESVDIRNQDPTRLPRRDTEIYQFRITALLRQAG